MKRFESTVVLLTIVLFLLVGVESVSAWNNKGTHPAINEWAVKVFEKDLRPLDKRLASTRLDGEECRGIAWDPQDGTANTTQSIAVNRKKSLVRWIVDGGFSADEPEILMGLRHFYDPRNASTPWLTDTHGVADWLKSYVTPERGVPEIDAVTWAIDKNDTGDDGAYGVQDWISISQDYSWFDAKKYFKLALANENRDNVNYGKAWRAVGEVMHMMADMAVPAHVRNDGHMWSEPLEDKTDSSRVNACAGLTPANSINYDTGIETLMRALALWTNSNFLSQDTVPLPGKSTTANGMPSYPSPIPTKTTGTYEYRTVDGQSVILARIGKAGLLGRFWKGNNAAQAYQVDDTAVLQSQQSILIPTAIRACASVLNRFLPRFEISAEVYQRPDMTGTSSYSIHGEVAQFTSGTDWNERLTIKNGVYLVVNGEATAIPKRIAGGDFNWFTHDFSAKENDQVWLRYDLGGYVVESEKVKIAATTNSDIQFTKTWEKVHWPSWHPELATIVFTVKGTGDVQAIKPLIELKDFANSKDSKIIKVSHVKRNENVIITGSLQPTLSKTKIEPYAPLAKSIYVYSNPKLVRCKEYYSEEQIVERYSGLDFSWTAPVDPGAGGYYYKTHVYIVYDLHVEDYRRPDEDSSFVLASTSDGETAVFHLQLEVTKDLAEWETP